MSFDPFDNDRLKLSRYAIRIVTEANMASNELLLEEAEELEKLSKKDYLIAVYEDEEGLKLLASIAQYLRNKLVIK